ncbi:MAG: transglycosylase SLT domain-containing protein [Deltaproteobacteria bacterium]|nr:transglycosylase SLT domain-containing protein [Deltaproteobacteria bacterium]
MRLRQWLILGLCGFLFCASPISSLPAHSGSTTQKTFAVPPALKEAVAFWRDIYAKYDKDHVVLHDTEDLGIVYEVVDLTDIGRRTELTQIEISELRRERIRTAMERVGAGLDRAAHEHLRSQTGQKEKFIAGITASGRYMPIIEKIFKEGGIPQEVSRLVFVESMFQLHAFSKAGASGIWQFMPGTARLYGLTADRYVDERNDPIAATQAAARLLKADYEAIGSWPLAINAYNAGRGRLLQATARLGTKDIARIVGAFNHPGYGFASRNFYPEFLAALDVYENRVSYFGSLPIDPPLAFEAIITAAPAPLPTIARVAGITSEALRTLNPGFSEAVLAGETILPAGYTLKVPLQKGAPCLAAISTIGRELIRHGYYIVQKGETLPRVATKTGVPLEELKTLNGLRGTALSAGQILRLPAAISAATME